MNTGEHPSAPWYNDPKRLDLARRTFCKGSTDDEFDIFVNVCQRTQLDPFARQIYATTRKIKKYDGTWGQKLEIQSSIDGFRVVAERSGSYEGQTAPLWCGGDGQWRDVWLSKDMPSACKIGVYRSNFKEPLVAIARFESYAQYTKTQAGGQALGHMWAKMPDLMIAKCAEALALRKAFPQDLSGLYTSDEMSQASNPDPEPHDDKPAMSPTKPLPAGSYQEANTVATPTPSTKTPPAATQTPTQATPEAPVITNWRDVEITIKPKNSKKEVKKKLGDCSQIYLNELVECFSAYKGDKKDMLLVKAALALRTAELSQPQQSSKEVLSDRCEKQNVDKEVLVLVCNRSLGFEANDFDALDEMQASYVLDSWDKIKQQVVIETDNIPE